MDVGDAVRLGRASPDCPLAVPQAYEMDGGLASVSECVDGEPRRPLLLLELRVPPPSRLYAARQWARVPMCLGTATGRSRLPRWDVMDVWVGPGCLTTLVVLRVPAWDVAARASLPAARACVRARRRATGRRRCSWHGHRHGHVAARRAMCPRTILLSRTPLVDRVV